MKKVILSMAMAAGIFAVTNVQASNTITEQPGMEVAFEDDGYVDVKFEDLNEKVQDAVRVVAEGYDLNALQYNAEKELTRVKATNKEDKSAKIFYFDAEGKEVVVEAEKQEPQEEQQEETFFNEENRETPSPESFSSNVKGDDGFVEVKPEDLNEKVQASINVLKETYDIGIIKYNAEKQITKVEAVNKEDQAKKDFYFDNEGVETIWEKPVEQVEQQEVEKEEVL